MAVLKHIASKSKNYDAALIYLLFEHNENTNQPILNPDGTMKRRQEFYIDGINCSPFFFAEECNALNNQYRKNQKAEEIKSHHYILSFDPKDKTECGLTGEQAQALGMEFAQKNFPGHQVLVCTHTDGHNGSENIHVHIVLNSVRKYDIDEEDYMNWPCERKAGCKHQVSRELLTHLQESVMDLCHREGLHQVDLLSPAEIKVTDKEYRKQQRGQKKLNAVNAEIVADGLEPAQTRFQTRKQELREAIEDAAYSATSFEQFQQALFEKYQIGVTEHRGRYNYQLPEREKHITERVLGTRYGKENLCRLFVENEKAAETTPHRQNDASKTNTQNASTFDFENDPITILYVRSNLRLVVDLQNCVKAQQNKAYAQAVKVSNLKEMAKTIAYIQEHGYNSQTELQTTYDEITHRYGEARKTVKDTEERIKNLNEQIHFTGQYYAVKAVYKQLQKVRDKKKFRQEHSTEIEQYEKAVHFLKQLHGEMPIPSIRTLTKERDSLVIQKKAQYETYQYFKEYQKELRTVCNNVDAILQDHTQERQRTPVQSHE